MGKRKLIGLIGSTAGEFFVEEFLPTIDKYKYAWYGWTIPIRLSTLKLLKDQMREIGYFRLYGYSSSGCYERPSEATHKVVAAFIIGDVVSHWDTGREYNPIPEREKGIQGYNDFYLIDREVTARGKELPRRTWFKVTKLILLKTPLELSDAIFNPWNTRHKIHTSPLRSNFIDIVDNLTIT